MVNELNKEIADIEADTGKNIDASEVEEFALHENKTLSDEEYQKRLIELESMNFVELSKTKKEIKNEYDAMKMAKPQVESLLAMKNDLQDSLDQDTPLAAAVAEANLESNDIMDMENFLETYDDTIAKMESLLRRVDELIASFDSVEKTSSYLSNCMCELLDKQAARIDEEYKDSPHAKHLRIYYKEVSSIFKNRTDISWVTEKMKMKSIELRRFKESVKKDKFNAVIPNTWKRICGGFSDAYDEKQMTHIKEYITNLLNGDETTSFYFMYVLYLIRTRERQTGKYGKHKWVDILCMNIMDIIVDNYDLEGGKEFYDQQILKLVETLKSL